MRASRDGALTDGAHPDYRFSLANERTFLAHLRTSLAFCAAGVAVLQFVDVLSWDPLDSALGISLLGLGILTSATSFRRWRTNEIAIREGRPLPSSVVSQVLAYGLTAVLVVAVVDSLLR